MDGKHCVTALVIMLTPHILDPWLHAYQNLSKRERDAPMEKELPTTCKMRRVKEGRSLVVHCPEFERYKDDLIAGSVVFFLIMIRMRHGTRFLMACAKSVSKMHSKCVTIELNLFELCK